MSEEAIVQIVGIAAFSILTLFIVWVYRPKK